LNRFFVIVNPAIALAPRWRLAFAMLAAPTNGLCNSTRSTYRRGST